jgi:hypothetical protein
MINVNTMTEIRCIEENSYGEFINFRNLDPDAGILRQIEALEIDQRWIQDRTTEINRRIGRLIHTLQSSICPDCGGPLDENDECINLRALNRCTDPAPPDSELST